jgi:hypothetical protein
MAVYEKPEMYHQWCRELCGKYVLASKKAKVYIVKRAGGLTSVANIEGVKIKKRPIQAKQIEAVESVNLNLGEKRQYSKIN